MLAVPLSACFAVLIDEMYVKDILGDTTEEPAADEAPAQSPAVDMAAAVSAVDSS